MRFANGGGSSVTPDPPRAPAAPGAAAVFHVSVHDAAPRWEGEIGVILGALAPRVGTTLSAAVVPCWHGVPLSGADRAFARLVGEGADELLLHGWSHRREGGSGSVSLVTGGADEFSGLGRAEALRRIVRGRALVASVFGRPASGFLPPAFRSGPVDSRTLGDAGIAVRVGWASAERMDGRRARLATRTWDVSPCALLGPLAAFAGRCAALRAGAIPTIAIHPADVRRGHLPRALAAVDALLAAGARPLLVHDLLGAAGAPG